MQAKERARQRRVAEWSLTMRKIIFFTLISISGYAASLESMLLESVQALPLNYRIIKTCGDWRVKDTRGYYRLVVADVDDGAGSEVYVQWITHSTLEQKSKLIKTLAFSELNNDHAQYLIQTATCEKKGGFAYVTIKALYEHDEKDLVHHFLIRLIDIGKYELGENSVVELFLGPLR
ncbi:hypothetical protein [Curvibacter gracilis]|uniref:hypothetical protein n=1 Tax=Curvibacter gracilis TaxID=230310 RepID=UPI0012F75220|nr:hypothetical protein [Curvibacter gracilis]